MKNARILIFILLFGVVYHKTSLATHLRAGEITVKRVGCSPTTFDVTVTVYTDTESGVKFGGNQADGLDVLDFGDGHKFIIPETNSTPYSGDNTIGIASYTVRHIFSPGRWLISYREPNRNDRVLNMTNSVLTTFYIETLLNNEPLAICNNTPRLKVPPIDRGCVGVAFQHNPGAFDPDGDSLSYELVTPYKDRNTTVDNYLEPNNRKFYAGNYDESNEEQEGPPTFTINEKTGTITWDAPGQVGEFNIAFHIVEWREIEGIWTKLGYVRRDMQIIVEDCDNERPDLILPNDTCVVAGTTLEAIIKGFDVPNEDGEIQDFTIEAFSEIFDASFTSPAVVTPKPANFPATTAQNPAELNFSWDVVCEHVKDQPYQIVFKITDKGRPKLATFKTWFVKVVGPPPVWEPPTVDLAKRHVLLEWENYECPNASTMEIWRKVDSFAYTPSNCETGMPPSLGYELIDEVSISDTLFNDTNNGNGLNIGAKYCYRLVAKFPTPAGGESYMSEEICIDPILADAPVITHVTVEKTDAQDGEIRISWRSPFQIDPVQFPPPYEFKVWRSTGFAGATPWTEIHTGTISDTTVVDKDINTLDGTFSYHVVLHSATQGNPTIAAVDTSAVASMVKLDIQSAMNRLDLSWAAFTPWSNSSFAFPMHDVYRGPEGSTESTLTTILEQVNVTTGGFAYADLTINDTDVYCYRVMTRGTYGNPAIDEPLENYSQIVCAQGSDEIPPLCKPEALIVNSNVGKCAEYLGDPETCAVNLFYNDLRWNRVTSAECSGDVLGYKVYVASTSNGEFVPVTFSDGRNYTQDTVYLDDNDGAGLSSFARCYRVSVVDRSGNESELSNIVCNDNCPNYYLPNAFSPDGDGCNDKFSAFGDNTISGEEGSCIADPDNARFCARFVETVSFRVYNRWGTPVYEFKSVRGDNDQKSIYIRWDGKDNSGRPLNAGVYYYAADVVFTTSNPSNRNQTIKGWVHLIR